MKSNAIVVVLLAAFVYSLSTRQQLQSSGMQGFIQKREMASYARKTHAEENIDAHNQLRPHRQKWDNYNAQQDSLAHFEGTVTRQNDMNPFAKPGAKRFRIQNLGESAFRSRRRVVHDPDAEAGAINRPPQDLPSVVNQNLPNINQEKPRRSVLRKLSKYL